LRHVVGRPGKYIFLPRNSTVWHARFQYPATDNNPRKSRIVYNLGTRDKAEAILRSLSFIEAHLSNLNEIRERDNPDAERRPVSISGLLYPLGKHELEDGITVHAGPEVCFFVAPDGQPLDQRPNRVERFLDGPGWTRAEYVARLHAGTLPNYKNIEELGEPDCPGWRDEVVHTR
jgi:hypothetical protein